MRLAQVLASAVDPRGQTTDGQPQSSSRRDALGKHAVSASAQRVQPIATGGVSADVPTRVVGGSDTALYTRSRDLNQTMHDHHDDDIEEHVAGPHSRSEPASLYAWPRKRKASPAEGFGNLASKRRLPAVSAAITDTDYDAEATGSSEAESDDHDHESSSDHTSKRHDQDRGSHKDFGPGAAEDTEHFCAGPNMTTYLKCHIRTRLDRDSWKRLVSKCVRLAIFLPRRFYRGLQRIEPSKIPRYRVTVCMITDPKISIISKIRRKEQKRKNGEEKNAPEAGEKLLRQFLAYTELSSLPTGRQVEYLD